MNKFIKDPDAVLDYQVDWSVWLGDDTIASSTWIVPDGITKGFDANTTTTATIWLSGGIAGLNYTITNRITTDNGRTDDRTITIQVQDK